MKNTLFLLGSLLLLLCPSTKAQFNENPVLNIPTYDEPILNWGYFLGLNQYGFKFDYKNNNTNYIDEILVLKNFGFNVGLIGEMRLNKFLDIRFEPGLHYNARSLRFPYITNPNTNSLDIREVKSTYINFPILLKVSTKRIGNWKPFLIGGFSTSINLGSNETSLDDNSTGRKDSFRMKKNIYSYEIGFGIDFYTEYFKFAPSIRGVFAISDELVRDADPNSQWTGNIAGMRTRGIFINFTFE